MLVPFLLETLLKQEEDQDQGESIWNLSIVGDMCLGIVVKTANDGIFFFMMPFVEGNIKKSSWWGSKLATFAFRSIFESLLIKELLLMVHIDPGFFLML